MAAANLNPDIIFAIASKGGVLYSPMDSSLGVGLRSVVLHGHSTSLRPYSTALNLIQSTTLFAPHLSITLTTGSIQDKSFLATGGLGLPVRHSGGACQSYRIWRSLSNYRQMSISPAPQRINRRISRRRCRIVTRKGAAIYEFHGESEFDIEGVRVFVQLAKKSGSKYVGQRK